MLNTFIQIAALAFLPTALWVFIYYFKDKFEPEPLRLVWHCFYYGMIGAVPLVLLQIVTRLFPDYEPMTMIWGHTHSALITYLILFIIVAFIEEYMKHVGITLIDIDNPNDINQVVDGIIYGVAAAAGFAFIENMVYFFKALGSGMHGAELTWIFIARAFGATLAHTLFSGVFGYFYAKAKLLPYIRKDNKEPMYKFGKFLFRAVTFHIIRTHILIGRPSLHRHHAGELVAEGFLLAVLLHFTYNMWVGAQVFGTIITPLAIPALYLGFFFMSRVFLSKTDTEIVRSFKEQATTMLVWPELKSKKLRRRDLNL
jgi:RsiW-degrading membrane proteinase PrsW (M82 family)